MNVNFSGELFHWTHGYSDLIDKSYIPMLAKKKKLSWHIF